MRRSLPLLPAAVVVALLAGCGAGTPVVPEQYRADVRRAAKECPQVTAPLIAAQIQQESGWDPDAVSPSGAEGIAQFMPETWQRWGVDLDGDGVADPFDAAEAIDAQGRLMCYLVRTAEESGIDGDAVTLALAAYNAGWSNVVKYGGVPPFPETEDYVAIITDLTDHIRLQ